jgi:hypothetical protein
MEKNLSRLPMKEKPFVSLVFLMVRDQSRAMLKMKLVAPAGLEPARPCGQAILSRWRLPFRHGADLIET